MLPVGHDIGEIEEESWFCLGGDSVISAMSLCIGTWFCLFLQHCIVTGLLVSGPSY